MIRSLRFFVCLVVTVLAPFALQAQVATGTLPFGSFAGSPDVVNLANLNVLLTIPMVNKPGRGTPFNYNLTYNSSVWTRLGTGGSGSWQPVFNWGWAPQSAATTGYVSYMRINITCDIPPPPVVQYNVFSNIAYTDAYGIRHPFAGQLEYDPNNCDQGTSPLTNIAATDGSGLVLTVAAGAPVLTTHTITTPVGTVLNPPASFALGGYSGVGANSTDRNGNQITVSSTSSTATFTDTLGTTALSVSGTGTSASPMVFSYTDSTGAAASYTMKFATFTVRTNFGCGVTDYGTNGTTTAPLVTEIDLPDGVSKYTFAYETTPAHAGSVTGRLASVTLPTGGMITYAYSGGGTGVNGINCVDGSAAILTRDTPDGQWTYAQTNGSGAASATLITAPKLSYDSLSNQTIAQFQGIYPTQTNVYQGAAPTFTTLPISETTLQAGNLLQETQTCYNGGSMPCPTLAITLPITQRTSRARLQGSGGLWTQHTDEYNSFGSPTESDDYDFAAVPPGTRLRQTLTTYATLGGSLSAFPQTVKIVDASGAIQSRQDTAYDGSSLTCVSGAPAHDDTHYPCGFTTRGNATSTTTYTSPSVPSGGITKNFTYDSLGNLRTAQLNCCQLKSWAYSATTDYAYPDSVTSGSSAPQLTTTSTYDLHMGLVLTSTDPNNLVTTNTYDNLGRPLTTP